MSMHYMLALKTSPLAKQACPLPHSGHNIGRGFCIAIDLGYDLLSLSTIHDGDLGGIPVAIVELTFGRTSPLLDLIRILGP